VVDKRVEVGCRKNVKSLLWSSGHQSVILRSASDEESL
jgi:hypothetical protein